MIRIILYILGALIGIPVLIGLGLIWLEGYYARSYRENEGYIQKDDHE